MSIDMIGTGIADRTLVSTRDLMSHELMAKKIKIDPLFAAPPLPATKHVDIELTRCFQIFDGKSEVEG
jgi:hypothetical protein